MAASGGSLAPDIMVFRPTMEEFKDFSGYIANMESQGAHKAGIAKIVPPKSWCPCKGGYDNIDLVIPAPISQVVTGSQGLFQQVSVQRKSMSVSEFKKLAESSKYKTPHHTDYEDLERKYWDCMTSHSPIYGADVSGSIYDDGVKEFNIQHLNTILDLVANDYGVKIEGVNTAYLYFGMWKTTFAWHTEDMDLYSINYLHFGAPKSWYAIPPEHGHLLEQVAASYFYDSLQNCPAYLRHKMIIMSPDILKKYSVPFSKITQEPGEFIITFPYGYHSGYNHGFNCAESTNFAMPRWVEYGKRAVVCNCQNDSVKISMDVFIRKFQPERYGLWKTGKDVGPHPEDPSRHYAASPINDQVVSVLDLISDRLHQPRLSFPKWKCEANEYGLKLTVDASRKRPSRLCHQTTRSPGESTLCGGESSSFPYASFFTSIAKNKKTKKVKANSENLENPPNLTLGDAAEKKEGNANQEYSPKSELRKFIKNVKEAAVSWAYPISDIQKHQELNLEAEKQFNIWMSSFEPHCSVCIIFTTVSNQNRVSFEDFPSSSLVKMPEICFSKNIDVHCKQDKNPLLRRDGSSPLLVCFVCHVCVHASCYGVKFLEYGLWTCSRCANQAEDAECCLCSLRGGALKPTTDGRWAHIVCASFIQEAYFEDVVLRGPVNILRLTSNMSSKCIYCSKLLKSNTGCCIQCSSSRCSSSFHVTCGHLAGSSFEHRDWPDLFSISCVKHSSHKTKSRKRELTDVSVGDAVLAEHKNHKYQWAEVKNKYCQTYYSVVFPDYSTCTDLLPEDIVNENGIEHELPEIDDRVLVKWTDGEIYKCLFKGSRSFDVYVVEFSDCTSTKLERHQFYSTDEELPNEVSSKVAWSRGKSKTSCAVQQNNKRICLRNVN